MNNIERAITVRRNVLNEIKENFMFCLKEDGWVSESNTVYALEEQDCWYVSVKFTGLGLLNVLIKVDSDREVFSYTLNYSSWGMTESYDRLIEELEELVYKAFESTT